MNFNQKAFLGINDRKYKMWPAFSMVQSFYFIEKIKDILNLENIETIFDIGSKDACQALEFSDWFPNSKIHLFEPVIESYDWCTNVTKNRKNIQCHNVALSNFTGESTFYKIINGNIGASSLYKISQNSEVYKTGIRHEEIKIPVFKADEIIKKYNISKVDLIWADVQGSEITCLEGFGISLDKVKAIHVEVAKNNYYDGGTDEIELKNFMEKKGFYSLTYNSNFGKIDSNIIFINKNHG